MPFLHCFEDDPEFVYPINCEIIGNIYSNLELMDNKGQNPIGENKNRMIITCTNKTKTEDSFNRYTHAQCGDCLFLYTHRCQAAECRCPVKVKYRDKIEYIPEKVKNLSK